MDPLGWLNDDNNGGSRTLMFLFPGYLDMKFIRDLIIIEEEDEGEGWECSVLIRVIKEMHNLFELISVGGIGKRYTCLRHFLELGFQSTDLTSTEKLEQSTESDNGEDKIIDKIIDKIKQSITRFALGDGDIDAVRRKYVDKVGSLGRITKACRPPMVVN